MPIKRAPVYKKQLLGQIFLKKGLISKEQLKEALDLQKTSGGFLGDLLIRLGYLNEIDLVMGLSSQCSVPYVPVLRYKIPQEALEIIPKDMATKYNFIPLDKFKDTLTISMVNPLDEKSYERISEFSKLNVLVCIATSGEIHKAIEKNYKQK